MGKTLFALGIFFYIGLQRTTRQTIEHTKYTSINDVQYTKAPEYVLPSSSLVVPKPGNDESVKESIIAFHTEGSPRITVMIRASVHPT